MSQELSSEAYLFHTDIGTTKTTVKVIDGYDVENMISEKAFSYAMALRFQLLAEDIDVNSPVESRTIKTSFLEDANG